jgi:hypothetical protein
MKKWFNQRGIMNLVEMEWWQESSIPGHPEYFIAATPAMVFHLHPYPLITRLSLYCRSLYAKTE